MMYMCTCAFKHSFLHEPVLNSTQTQLDSPCGGAWPGQEAEEVGHRLSDVLVRGGELLQAGGGGCCCCCCGALLLLLLLLLWGLD